MRNYCTDIADQCGALRIHQTDPYVDEYGFYCILEKDHDGAHEAIDHDDISPIVWTTLEGR